MTRIIVAAMLTLSLSAVLTSPVAKAQFDRLPTTQPGPHAAQVVGAPGRAVQDLFEVDIIAVDGRNISARDVLWLEPGTYELTVSIKAEFTRSGPRPSIRSKRRQPPGYNIIELELEAGKRYHILARHLREAEDGHSFRVILHRVDDI